MTKREENKKFVDDFLGDGTIADKSVFKLFKKKRKKTPKKQYYQVDILLAETRLCLGGWIHVLCKAHTKKEAVEICYKHVLNEGYPESQILKIKGGTYKEKK